jgi:hypothetical protein
MGLLDDAIREHLDLKRRHGADPSEVERAEREALGPVRRAPEAAPELEFSDQAGGEPSVAFDHDDTPPWDEPALEAEPDQAEEERASSGGISRFLRRRPRTTPDEPPESEGGLEDSAADESLPFDEEQPEDRRPPAASRDLRASAGSGDLMPPDSGPAATPMPHSAGGAAGGETVEYDVADALRQSPGEADDDVLEETPEFLQDTPDHDRLWFEQRPPRDFDFDE